jgi:hypothetical protein
MRALCHKRTLTRPHLAAFADALAEVGLEAAKTGGRRTLKRARHVD